MGYVDETAHDRAHGRERNRADARTDGHELQGDGRAHGVPAERLDDEWTNDGRYDVDEKPDGWIRYERDGERISCWRNDERNWIRDGLLVAYPSLKLDIDRGDAN
jgi:hypothetical protein